MPSDRNRQKRLARHLAGTADIRVIAQEDKQVANSVCVWCQVDQGGYRVICRRCGCCQYCGFYCGVRESWCRFCNNQPMSEDVVGPEPITRIAGRPTHGPQFRPKPKKGTVRRLGPKTRDRRHGGLV